MTAAIISIPHEGRFFADRLLPEPADKLVADGRIYLLYFVGAHTAADYAYTDLAGVPLIECRFFESESVARSWVEADVAFRAVQAGGVQ